MQNILEILKGTSKEKVILNSLRGLRTKPLPEIELLQEQLKQHDDELAEDFRKDAYKAVTRELYRRQEVIKKYSVKK